LVARGDAGSVPTLWLTIRPRPGAIKKEVNGSVSIQKLNPGVTTAKAPVRRALSFTAAPSYKPELQAKVKYLFDNEGKTDQVFYCGKPGTPRIGPPRKRVQTPGEVISRGLSTSFLTD
jgi:hypothetical protein